MSYIKRHYEELLAENQQEYILSLENNWWFKFKSMCRNMCRKR